MLERSVSEKFEEPRDFATSLQPLETDGATADVVTADHVPETSKNTSFLSTQRSREQKTEDEQNNDIVNKEPALKATVSGFQLLFAAQSRRNNSFRI